MPGTVLSASWLTDNGFSHDLQKHYRKSGWLESIGTGAFKRPHEAVTWEGGLYTLQEQLKMPVHAGGLTALSLLGVSHFLRMEDSPVYLFSPLQINLPTWLREHKWSRPIHHYRTSFLPADLGLSQYDAGNFRVTIASAERAVLECLYLAPSKMDLMECYQILSGLVNLRPKLVQELLEQCSSVKVKRLFLYMVEKAGHQWLDFIDRSSVNLGKGDRSIVRNGFYNGRYHITLPKEFETS